MNGNAPSIVFFSPHPDDEIISSGAFLSYLKNAGWRIHIVHITSGSDKALWDERESEALSVSRELGTTSTFLRSFRTGDPAPIIDQIMNILKEEPPDIVSIPSIRDPHPTHIFSHRVVDAVLKRSLYLGTIMSYSIWEPLHESNLIFPFDIQMMDRKLSLLEMYRSQLDRNDFIAAVKGLNRFYGVTRAGRTAGWDDTPEFVDGSIRNLLLPNVRGKKGDRYAEIFSVLPASHQPTVLALGDIFLDVLPDPVPCDRSEGSSHTNLSLSPGGNAANFSSALSRMGGSASLYAKVGDDRIADLLKHELREHGVRPFLLHAGSWSELRSEEAWIGGPVKPMKSGTAVTCALSFDDGTRHFFSDFGANLSFSSDDLPKLHSGFNHLHRAGYFWLPDLLGSPNEQLLRRARELGMTTSLDTGTPPTSMGSDPWTEDTRRVLHRLLPHVDILFGNESEILGIWGGTHGGRNSHGKDMIREGKNEDGNEDENEDENKNRNVDGKEDGSDDGHTCGCEGGDPLIEENGLLRRAARELMERGCGMVVIHRGADGASAFRGTEVFHVPARKVIPENPTGAGDIFNAGFIFRYLKDTSLGVCLEFAVAAGTYHVAHKCDPYPTLESICSFHRASGNR